MGRAPHISHPIPLRNREQIPDVKSNTVIRSGRPVPASKPFLCPEQACKK